MNKPIILGLATGKTLRLIVASILLILVGRTSDASGQTVTNLYSFIGTSSDGGVPSASLMQADDGNFYGTAAGGFSTFKTNNFGSVFRISPSGSFTNLYSFKGNDGEVPLARLVQGSDGNFYGTAARGGHTNLDNGIGFGSVFRITPTGALTNLYSFTGAPDGAFPSAGLVRGNDGNFYGVTSLGGITTNGSLGYGTIFRVSPNGGYTNLYLFAGSPNDGSEPNGLVLGSDGNLYGTTQEGGGNSCNCGILFRISPNGSYSNLYSFGSSLSDGGIPNGLVQGSDGNFYGTTQAGGNSSPQNPGCCGVVFRISPSGSYTTIYAFRNSPNDGRTPTAGLVQGSDGSFYGSTQQGGSNVNCYQGCGTVFRVSPSGSETNLYSFGNFAGDGTEPNASLVQGSDGSFYGTTTFGGINGSGTVYRLSIPLSPPANQISAIQLSGTTVIFNIPSVAYETYQLQFSSSMSPTNWVNVPGASVTNSIGALLALTNFGGAVGPQGFYRFDITP